MFARHCTVTAVFVQEVGRAPVAVPAQAVGNMDAVTEVATPKQLQQAVQQGARHIEVTTHMDLSSLDAALYPGGVLLGVFSDTTRSIRVCVRVLRPLAPLFRVLFGVCVPCTTNQVSPTVRMIYSALITQQSLFLPLLSGNSMMPWPKYVGPCSCDLGLGPSEWQIRMLAPVFQHICTARG